MVRISSSLMIDRGTGVPPTTRVKPALSQLRAMTKGVNSQETYCKGRWSRSESLSECRAAIVLGVTSQNISRMTVRTTVAIRMLVPSERPACLPR
jgi:hypothetical protein